MRLPARLLRRSLNAHKRDFGHIFILAGSLRFSGAAVLCAEGALRSGAGLVTLGVPESLSRPLIKIKPKEVMLLSLPEGSSGTLSLSGYRKIKKFIEGIDVLIIGPGLGQDKSTQSLVRKIVAKIKKPMVIDADGLNALVGHLNILRNTQYLILNTKILTPHPGEMARLLGVSAKKIQNNRKEVAKIFASDYNCILVLKGHKTVVADEKNVYLNPTGNPGMATAGSGDVLAGIIGALLGQGLDAFSAAKYAVYLHGLAGDLAAEEKTQLGMIASDIIEKLPEAIKRCS